MTYLVNTETEECEWVATVSIRTENTTDVSSLIRQVVSKTKVPHIDQSRVFCERIRPGEYMIRMSVDAVDAYAASTKAVAVLRSAIRTLTLGSSTAKLVRLMVDEVVHRG